MDPLSISASVAGLLTLAVQVISTCDTLYASVKKRPKILKALSNDLISLQQVLSDLQKNFPEKPAGDESALIQCLRGCDEVLRDIWTEVRELQTMFERNFMVQAYAQITFKSKMESILESRAQIERYTHTMNFALAIRQRASTATINAKLNQIQGDLAQARRQTGRPVAWLNPIQQYVEASTAIISTKKPSSVSLAGMINSATLEDENLSRRHALSVESQNDPDLVSSYATLDEWLETLTSPSAASEVKKVLQQQSTGDVVSQPVQSHGTSHRIELRVSKLPKGSNATSNSNTQTLSLENSDFWDKALHLLNEKGYRRVCGFKLGDKFITPLTGHTDDVGLTVTRGPSTFSLAKGLEINIDESLEMYFDSFARAGEESRAILPMTFQRASDAGKIVIVDYVGDSCKTLEVGFNRTLRVPEDGTVYGLPTLFSPFPLINAEQLEPSKLRQLHTKGGLLMPSFSREALALSFHGDSPSYRHHAASADFAVRIYAGSVNIVSGSAHQQLETDAQDYVIAPHQDRLDGFLVRTGVVKQFVAMPLGVGYTAEGQITGSEAIGGFQILVAPRFRARGTFPGYPDQSLTPRKLGLRARDRLLMAGDAVEKRSREFRTRVASSYSYSMGHGIIFHSSARNRPLFVHEIISREDNFGLIGNTMAVEAVFPYRVTILAKPPVSHLPPGDREPSGSALLWSGTLCEHAKVFLECSPFLGVSDLETIAAKALKVDSVDLFVSNKHKLEDEPHYVPLHTVISDDAIIYGQCHYKIFQLSDNRRPEPEKQVKPKQELQWDMGLTPGGEIQQQIISDPDPLEWNWARARLINVQILNSIIFESVTGICPPEPPISFNDYIEARLPFYHIIENEGVAERLALSHLKTVGGRDAESVIPLSASVTKDNKIVGCTICEKSLADSILRPCKHVFCSMCVRDRMVEGGITRCGACRQIVKELVNYAAPMELPMRVKNHSRIEGRKFLEATTPPIRLSSAAFSSQAKRTSTQAGSSATKQGFINGRTRESAFTAITPLQKLALSGSIELSEATALLVADGYGNNEPIASERGRTAMQSAASSGNNNLVSSLIKMGIEANEAPCVVGGRSSLQGAAEGGHFDIVTQLLSAGADVNGPVSMRGGRSALEAAAAAGDPATVDELLRHGASLLWSPDRQSALHLAAEGGFETIVSLLLTYGFDPHAHWYFSEVSQKTGGSHGVRPIHLAARNNHLKVVNILRDHGGQESPIDVACAYGHLNLVAWLLDCEVKAEAEHGKNEPASYIKQELERRWLARYGRDRQSDTDEHGYVHRSGYEGLLDRLVTIAVKNDHLEVLKWLVSRGGWLRVPKRVTDLQSSSLTLYQDTTYLHEAVKSGSLEVVKYLLAMGFDVEETRSYESRTPLMEAAGSGRDECFKLLVMEGANIHGTSITLGAAQGAWTRRDKTSVMCEAARGGSANIMDLLLDLGVDPAQTIGPVDSPLSVAIEAGNVSLAWRILERLSRSRHGMDDYYGRALQAAVCKGHVQIVKELLRRGADPNLLDCPYYLTHASALSQLADNLPNEVSETDLLECARAIFAAGGKLRDQRYRDPLQSFWRMTDRGYLELATFYLEHCLDESNSPQVEWLRHLEDAAKKVLPELLRRLIWRYRRFLSLSGGLEVTLHHSQIFMPWSDKLVKVVEKAANAGNFEILDILLQAASPLTARGYVKAAIVSLHLDEKSHMRQYLEERYPAVTDSYGNSSPYELSRVGLLRVGYQPRPMIPSRGERPSKVQIPTPLPPISGRDESAPRVPRRNDEPAWISRRDEQPPRARKEVLPLPFRDLLRRPKVPKRDEQRDDKEYSV